MPIFSGMVKGKIYVGGVKPFFDLLGALLLFTSLLPFLLFIAIVVSIDTKKSPIFVQKRIGKNEKAFNVYKFRSMKVNDEEKTITVFGKFIRSMSIDELPQLVNVIKGEMSLVGPRPLLPEYIPYYNESEKLRHLIRPGISGWAQVSGRNSIDWAKRMEFDIFYVNSVSFMFDLKIIFLTFKSIMKRDNTTYKDDTTIKFSDYASKR